MRSCPLGDGARDRRQIRQMRQQRSLRLSELRHKAEVGCKLVPLGLRGESVGATGKQRCKVGQRHERRLQIAARYGS